MFDRKRRNEKTGSSLYRHQPPPETDASYDYNTGLKNATCFLINISFTFAANYSKSKIVSLFEKKRLN